MSDTPTLEAAELAAAVDRLTDAMVSHQPRQRLLVDDVCTLLAAERSLTLELDTLRARVAELEANWSGAAETCSKLHARVRELEAERAAGVLDGMVQIETTNVQARAALAAADAAQASPAGKPTVPSAAVLLAEQVLHMDMVTDRGLRARDLARKVLDNAHDIHEGECAEVLRSIASYLGAGGYNAPAVDPAVFREKIMWGIEQINGQQPTPAALSVQAEPAATTQHMGAIGFTCAVFKASDAPPGTPVYLAPQPPAPVPAHSVGAEGLPPMPKGELMGSGVINGKRVELRMHDDDALRAYALAALASRPAQKE